MTCQSGVITPKVGGVLTPQIHIDAMGNEAKSFYEHYGFTPCRDNPMTLYLALGS